MAKLCALQYAAGRIEDCPGSRCPFWEEGGAVVEPGCMLERFLPVEDWTPELAQRWLALRLALDRSRELGQPPASRTLFYRLLERREGVGR